MDTGTQVPQRNQHKTPIVNDRGARQRETKQSRSNNIRPPVYSSDSGSETGLDDSDTDSDTKVNNKSQKGKNIKKKDIHKVAHPYRYLTRKGLDSRKDEGKVHNDIARDE